MSSALDSTGVTVSQVLGGEVADRASWLGGTPLDDRLPGWVFCLMASVREALLLDISSLCAHHRQTSLLPEEFVNLHTVGWLVVQDSLCAGNTSKAGKESLDINHDAAVFTGDQPVGWCAFPRFDPRGAATGLFGIDPALDRPRYMVPDQSEPLELAAESVRRELRLEVLRLA